jgi:secreted trypsin-like serine protease
MNRKFTSILFAVAGLVFLNACTPATSSQQQDRATVVDDEVSGGIVGGTLAGPRLTRSVVGIYDAETSYLCSGSLISPHLVLTAAHCIGSDIENMKIMLGGDLNDGKALVVAVDKVKVHDFFAPLAMSDRSDIALLYFSTDLPEGYSPMALPNATEELSKNDLVYMAGFGDTDFGKNDAGMLRVTYRKGIELVPGASEFQMNVSDGRGTCVGDSGGPILLKKNGKFLLIGMDSAAVYNIDPVTHEPKQNPCRNRGIFTRVQYFLPWIHETLKTWKMKL